MHDPHENFTPRDSIKICEIFGPTVQGEGALIGQPTVFVRAGGCDYRCSWCDTPHAVESEYRDKWISMSSAEILAKVEERCGENPLLITLSGGNPAIQPFEPLIDLGRKKGYGFAVETQGSIPRPWFSKLDALTLSPKPPSSEMETDWHKLDACVQAAESGEKTETVLKLVVRDVKDYAYARACSDRYPALPVYLQPLNEQPADARGKTSDGRNAQRERKEILDRTAWLVDFVMRDHWYKPRILPQLHVLLWGDKKGV